jgi:hypothetical protein
MDAAKTKQYAKFWADPKSVSLDWLAMLFLIMALGTFFSTFMAPHELAYDSDVPAERRFQDYRMAAGAALAASKYTSPGKFTVQAMILYVESEFLVNRMSQMRCYVLSSTCIRIMLKTGLHRDPSKLPSISPFEGEMRRRMWNLAVQLDLMVSFHLGLPAMIHGIESDTNLPSNLLDEDISEDCAVLPPARPTTDYTPLTYPIWKSAICRIFGLVAKQAHSLTLPTYAEVTRLATMLEDKWAQVPSFMLVKPLEDSVTDPPQLINQRYGLNALYYKSRCVLHRRYLIEAVPKREHAASRRICLQSALSLLQGQAIIYEASRPGGMLRQNGWFLNSLAVHDFLLAAMCVYLVVRSQTYTGTAYDLDWNDTGVALPDKQELTEYLRRSREIWNYISVDTPVAKKAAVTLDIMCNKLGLPAMVRRPDQTIVALEDDGAMSSASPEVWNSATATFEPVPVEALSIHGRI